MTTGPEVARGDVRALCEHLVRRLASEPDAVEVVEEVRGDERVLIVRVAPADRGKVIGKGGRVVRALRTVVRAGVVRSGERVHVEVDAPELDAAPAAGEDGAAPAPAEG